MRRLMFFCLPYSSHRRGTLLALVFFAILSGLLSVLMPYVTGSFIDFLTRLNGSYKDLLVYTGIFLFLAILSSVFGYIVNMLFVKETAKVSYSINRNVVESIHSAHFADVSSRDPVAWTQKNSGDSNRVASFFTNTLRQFPVSTIMLILPCWILLETSWVCACIVLAFSVIYLCVFRLMRDRLYQAGLELREIQASFFSVLSSQLQLIRFIKDNNTSYLMLDRLDNSFEKMFGKTVRYQRLNYLFSSLDTLVMVSAQVVLFLVGGMMVFSSIISIGQFTMLSSYCSIVVSAIRYYFNLGKDVQDSLVSLDRLEKAFELEKERFGHRRLEAIDSIRVENLSLAVSDNVLIKEMDYSFERGKVYGIVGRNGCGKTTFVHCLLGETDCIVAGNIEYNGTKQRDVDFNDARSRLMCYCEQSPVIIRGTLLDNLTFNGIQMPGNEPREVSDFYEMGSLTPLRSERRSDGEDAPCGGWISNEDLSGGEKQKIAIVRSLIKGADLLILDEPSSALDWSAKNDLLRKVEYMKDHSIVILITHDQDLLRACDAIVKMEDYA